MLSLGLRPGAFYRPVADATPPLWAGSEFALQLHNYAQARRAKRAGESTTCQSEDPLIKISGAHATTLEIPSPMEDLHDAITAVFTDLRWTSIPADGEWVAKVGLNLWSWGETVTVRQVGPHKLAVTSRCSIPIQVIDWGKNRKNVVKFCAALKASVQS